VGFLEISVQWISIQQGHISLDSSRVDKEARHWRCPTSKGYRLLSVPTSKCYRLLSVPKVRVIGYCLSPQVSVVPQVRPYKINYLVLRPIFPIFDAGGRHFFFYYCKVYRNDAGGIFSNMTKMWYTNTWKNNSRMVYCLFFSCFIGNYIIKMIMLSFVGYRDCSAGCRNNQ
jgi:hypothetical protein